MPYGQNIQIIFDREKKIWWTEWGETNRHTFIVYFCLVCLMPKQTLCWGGRITESIEWHTPDGSTVWVLTEGMASVNMSIKRETVENSTAVMKCRVHVKLAKIQTSKISLNQYISDVLKNVMECCFSTSKTPRSNKIWATHFYTEVCLYIHRRVCDCYENSI